MPFDEDLRRQIATLTDRIRDEVMRQLASAMAELTSSIEAEQARIAQAGAESRIAAEQAASARLAAAITTTEQQAAGHLADAVAAAEDRGRASGRAEGQEDGFARGRQEGRAAVHAEARALERAKGERLLGAVRAMDQARSLSDILDALTNLAGAEAARVSLLLALDGRIREWRATGFEAVHDGRARFDVPLEEAGFIADAVRSGHIVTAETVPGTPTPAFATLPPGRPMLAAPILVDRQVVAVLYADQGSGEADPAAAGRPEARADWQAVLEVLTRHASRCLEGMTAFRAAQLFTEGPVPPIASAAPWAGRDRLGDATGAAASASVGDDDDAARRYARLLISEIKRSHEPEVIAGRRDRDVASRLGGEIARARVLYDQRVPAHVRSGSDHFHAELVRTLANGDPGLLGQTR